MHQEVMHATRVKVAHYVALNYDEVFTLHNHSWLFVHYYVVENWVRILIFIFLDRVVEGSWPNNLTKVSMETFFYRWWFSTRLDCHKIHMFWGRRCQYF
jgi:hypothetical protein